MNILMLHVNCGGNVAESTLEYYEYEKDPWEIEPGGAAVEIMPLIFCDKCLQEIEGDAQIWFCDEATGQEVQLG